MTKLAKRNLKLYFRDKSAVFFSLLAVFIIIFLYAIFLNDVWDLGIPQEDTALLMNSWLIAGILAVASVTTTMGAFGIMVEDKVKKLHKDFYASPLKRSNIAGGYVLSAFAIGLIMSLLTLLLGELYIVLKGGQLLPPAALGETFLIISLSTFANTALVSFITSFFSSNNAFATASTIIGTLIGFLTGVYFPIGSLPSSVQFIMKIFPPTHSAALLREVFLARPIAAVFDGAPQDVIRTFKEHMGAKIAFDNFDVTPMMSVLFLLSTALIFYALTFYNISRKAR